MDWLLALQVKSGMKFIFPMNYLRGERIDELLDRTTLPPIEEFQNDLKQDQIDETTYNLIKSKWKEQNWKNMESYLKYYCVMDTHPAREAVCEIHNCFCITKTLFDLYAAFENARILGECDRRLPS